VKTGIHLSILNLELIHHHGGHGDHGAKKGVYSSGLSPQSPDYGLTTASIDGRLILGGGEKKCKFEDKVAVLQTRPLSRIPEFSNAISVMMTRTLAERFKIKRRVAQMHFVLDISAEV